MQGVAPQNRHITSLADEFLQRNWDRSKPLLLGYSGGPDSKALLYALLECGVTPHIAHVDHGWREESQEEARKIREEAEQLQCPFYSVRLELKEKKEDAARKGRFAFFSSLAPQFSALLLAHQADDLAETVLKRILEGAHIANLRGMEPVSYQYGMQIFRPFLNIRRSEILQFLQERSLHPIIDPSNSDPIYLRARMRLEIFPFLNATFGKEITENLALLSQRSLEFKQYLDRQIQNVPVQKGPWGTLVDLNGLDVVEQRHLIQKIGRDESLSFSREVLETLLKWVNGREKSKYLKVKTRKFLVDEGRLWVFSLDSKD